MPHGGVRTIAALPSIALIAGCASGLLADDLPTFPAYVVLTSSVVVALSSLIADRTLLLSAAVVGGFFAGGALLSTDAWQKAWRPPLRLEFERIARQQRTAAEQEGRRLPEDDEATVTIVGVLNADAAPAASGALISVSVVGLQGQEGQDLRPPWAAGARGNVLLTVLGSLVTQRIAEWRAGRVIRLPAQLRRPARYLDPGVPNGERALA